MRCHLAGTSAVPLAGAYWRFDLEIVRRYSYLSLR